MATVLHRLIEAPRPCSYLPDRQASHDIRIMVDVSSAEYAALLARGWRRFGHAFFRPVCRTCQECIGLRLPVAEFRPSRSQRRARRAAASLYRTYGPPQVDDERVRLYARWHREREVHRGWAMNALDRDGYAAEFASDQPFAGEVAFRDSAGRLVGLGLVDQVPDALSAVIFFWDPEAAPPSLGVAHIAMLVEQAAAMHLPYVYLGYRVAECPSLAYKSRYRPHELLDGRPDDRQPPRWQPAFPESI